MANLWRALAISWLGGIASPTLTGDMFPGEYLQPSVVISRPAEGDGRIETTEISWEDQRSKLAASRIKPGS
jgi:hypothetical protein